MAEETVTKAAVLQQKQTKKDLNSAIVLFRESVRLFKAAGSNRQAATALLELGNVYFILSRYEESLSSFRQVLKLLPEDRELRCRALSRMARVYASTGRPSLAGNYARGALGLSDGLSADTQAEAMEAAGEFYRDSDVPKATELFSRAGELFAKAGDRNGQAQTLLVLAFIRFRSDRQAALQFAAEALRLWSTENNQRGIAWVRRALGIFAAAADDFETARCNYQQALPVFQKIGDQDNEGIVLNVMGLATLRMGDAETALEYYRRADLILSSVHDSLGRGEAVKGVVTALRTLGRYRELLQLYQLKLRLAQQTQNRAQIAAALAEMAAIYERQHQYAKSENYYRHALSIYRSLGLDFGIGDALLGLAHLSTLQGENAQAIAFLEDALQVKGSQIEDVARINYELAYIYRRLNRLQEARAAIEKTIGIIESQRLSLAKFDSRAAYFASVHRYYALYVQILMLLHRQDPQQGLMELAFEASEKSKVRALLDLLSAASQESSCGDLLQRQLAPPAADGIQLQEAKRPVPDNSVLSLQQIQAELDDDHTVLLEYALGDEKSYLWVVGRKGITFHELPPADRIRNLVEVIRETPAAREPLPNDKTVADIRDRVRKAELAYQRSARELSASLLGPLEVNSQTRLLIVPDGSLQYVPFSALPLPATSEKNAMLMNRHEIVMLPSALALRSLRVRRDAAPPASIGLIVADPVFEPDDPRVMPNRNPGPKGPTAHSLRRGTKAGAKRDDNPVVRLPGSRVEARVIQQTMGNKVVVVEDFNATRSYVLKSNLAQYGFLHFATHGVIDLQRPEMSGLILSLINERGQKQDGHLRLGDIYGLKLSAGMVVLSACESALGKDLESEGTIGLPRAFLYAGAKCVIASLWKVDDDATAKFMKGFYARIKRGEGPSAALQGAQIEMSLDATWSNPFYWAAFVAQGDCK